MPAAEGMQGFPSPTLEARSFLPDASVSEKDSERAQGQVMEGRGHRQGAYRHDNDCRDTETSPDFVLTSIPSPN